jgi:RNA polymerase sigma-70 factor (ECF subfamily)
VQLAFVAAIQELPPRQRAALMRDVFGWAVNSMLQRAREPLAKRYPDGKLPAAARSTPEQQQLLVRYLRVWEGHDLDGFVALLKEDAFTMPPWYAGREAIRSFFAMAWQDLRRPSSGERRPTDSRFVFYERTGGRVGRALHPSAHA